MVTRVKRLGLRVIRKTRAKAPPIPVGGEEAVSPAVTGVERSPGKETLRAKSTRSIPQILLEEDAILSPSITGPGQKYALGQAAPKGSAELEEAALPDAYGTGKLFLTARDPQWLYAHWDFTLAQQRQYNALSADRHLVVRVYPGTTEAQPVREVHVHPESRHWFIHVGQADREYVAELGYYRPRHRWVTIATSGPTMTPADRASADQSVRFATIPMQAQLAELTALAKETVPPGLPPLEAAREQALAELVGLHLLQETSGDSAAIADFVQGGVEQRISAEQLTAPGPLGGESESVSSLGAPAEQRPAGFWFNINAELVLYGATEPDATVTIGGWPIQLRPDGTFSCRLALPEGDHAVTVSAMSAQGELRQAELEFSRRTDYRGEVGTAPEDPTLKPPGGEYP